ncbi:MAG TPA: hypothetical protein VK436_12530 [Methanocella sp.]|nr:hypothetical protein [Methanocella sp.]
MLITALSVSGCTTTQDSNNSSATAISATTSSKTTAHATDDANTTDTLSSLYNTGQYKWYEYRMSRDIGNGQNMTVDVKTELLGKGTDPKDGVEKEHTRDTTTILGDTNNKPVVTDIYTEPDANTTTTQGVDYSKSNAKLIKEGQETVTVPAGTFDCTRYSVTLSGANDSSGNTFWFSESTPIPVKLAILGNGKTLTYELVGWG